MNVLPVHFFHQSELGTAAAGLATDEGGCQPFPVSGMIKIAPKANSKYSENVMETAQNNWTYDVAAVKLS